MKGQPHLGAWAHTYLAVQPPTAERFRACRRLATTAELAGLGGPTPLLPPLLLPLLLPPPPPGSVAAPARGQEAGIIALLL